MSLSLGGIHREQAGTLYSHTIHALPTHRKGLLELRKPFTGPQPSSGGRDEDFGVHSITEGVDSSPPQDPYTCSSASSVHCAFPRPLPSQAARSHTFCLHVNLSSSVPFRDLYSGTMGDVPAITRSLSFWAHWLLVKGCSIIEVIVPFAHEIIMTVNVFLYFFLGNRRRFQGLTPSLPLFFQSGSSGTTKDILRFVRSKFTNHAIQN